MQLEYQAGRGYLQGNILRNLNHALFDGHHGQFDRGRSAPHVLSAVHLLEDLLTRDSETVCDFLRSLAICQ
jgi:hypothetical protein